MWREMESHCAAGKCALADGSRLSATANTTDCRGRLLAYEYGLTLQPARKPQLESFDALQLATTCGVTRPPAVRVTNLPLNIPNNGTSFFVDPRYGLDSRAGGIMSPFRTIHRALDAARSFSADITKTIVLQPGIHFLNKTLRWALLIVALTPLQRAFPWRCCCQVECSWNQSETVRTQHRFDKHHPGDSCAFTIGHWIQRSHNAPTTPTCDSCPLS